MPSSRERRTHVFLGTGSGAFATATTFIAGSGLQSIAAVDINGDNKLDIVCPSQGATALIALIGRGDGTFNGASALESSVPGIGGAAIADFDVDGKLDAMYPSSSQNAIRFLRGNGDGTFKPSIVYPSGLASPGYVYASDLDGDGLRDITVLVSGSAATVIPLKNYGCFP